MTLEQQREILLAAIARFPATFGLRAFPGDTFRLSESASYFPTLESATPTLYTQRLYQGQWCCFVKGTEQELRREMVAAPKARIDE